MKSYALARALTKETIMFNKAIPALIAVLILGSAATWYWWPHLAPTPTPPPLVSAPPAPETPPAIAHPLPPAPSPAARTRPRPGPPRAKQQRSGLPRRHRAAAGRRRAARPAAAGDADPPY